MESDHFEDDSIEFDVVVKENKKDSGENYIVSEKSKDKSEKSKDKSEKSKEDKIKPEDE